MSSDGCLRKRGTVYLLPTIWPCLGRELFLSAYIFWKKFSDLFMCKGVLSKYMCAYHMHTHCHWGSDESTRYLGTGVTDGCDPPHGSWEPKSGLLQEQPVFSLLNSWVYPDLSGRNFKNYLRILTYTVSPIYEIPHRDDHKYLLPKQRIAKSIVMLW